MKYKLIKIVAGVGLLSLLPACQTIDGPRIIVPTNSAYDGAWIGHMSITYREPACRLTRGGLRVRIEEGRIEGAARFTNVNSDFVGLVDEEGVLQFASLRGRLAKDDVELVGTFGERIATGTWFNELCRGEWELRKAR